MLTQLITGSNFSLITETEIKEYSNNYISVVGAILFAPTVKPTG